MRGGWILSAVAAAMAVAGCTNGSAEGNETTPSASSAAQTSAELQVVASTAYEPGRAPRRTDGRRALVLASDTVEFKMGGSSNCKPVARQPERRDGQLALQIVPSDQACLDDYRPYDVVVRFNQPVFADASLRLLRAGYRPGGRALPLVRIGAQ